MAQAPLLERETELEQLTGLLDDLPTTGGKVVLIRGEAGIGKTALVRGFLDQADGAHVLFGRCDELSTPQPLGPIWEIAEGEPALLEALQAGDRRGVFALLVDLMSRSLRPAVVVIEDAQWIDEATLDAVTYVGRRISQTNGMLLMTYREAQVDYEHPLRAVIGGLAPPDLVRIRLEPLSAAAVAELLVDSGLGVDHVMALTTGNPLFVREVIAAGAGSVPVSVRDAVMGRAARLSDAAAREVLELVAVCPGEVDVAVVEAAAGSTVSEGLAECVRSGLVEVDGGTVAFCHELGRVAVESALDERRRRELNAAVLAQLASVAGVSASRLAHHALRSGDADAVVKFVPVAARRAQALGSHREASAHFHSLEPYLEYFPAAERAGLLEEWAASESYVDMDRTRLLLLRAIELHRDGGDEVALARTLTTAVKASELAGMSEEADRFMSESLTLYEQMPAAATGPDHARARSTRAWLAMMQGRPREAVDLAAAAVEFADQVGAEEAATHALITQGCALAQLTDPKGAALVEEARKRAKSSGYPDQEMRATHNLGAIAWRERDIEQAVLGSQRALDMAIEREWPELVAAEQAELAFSLVRKGEWEEAEVLLNEVAARIHDEGQLRNIVEAFMAVIAMRRGRAGARDALDRALSHASSALPTYKVLVELATLAEWMWLNNETDTELTATIKERMDDALHHGFIWDAGEIALWLWLAGAIEDAPPGIAEPYRLIIAGEIETAAQKWAEKGCPYEQAIALSCGDTTNQLEALDILDQLGAIAVAAKLRQALRDQGVSVPPPRQRAQPRVGLTPRQTEVLLLIAEDLTNLQIADRLFISPRTVEHHVSAVLSKLDATNRDQAVAIATKQGMLTTS